MTAKWMIVLPLAMGFAIAPQVHAQSARPRSDSASAGSPSSTGPAAQAPNGEDLFANYGCGNCHTLAKAGAVGHVSPSFDDNANLTPEFVIERVSNGQGMMPAFTGQMTAEEMAALAKYVTAAAR